MLYATVCVASCLAALLTLYSGFGLGTLLMPVFALFFPLETAVAMTALVHLANNFFKLFLLGKYADKSAVIPFAAAAIPAALLGAWCLGAVSATAPLFKYELAGRLYAVTPAKLLLSLAIGFFLALESHPVLKTLTFEKRWLPAGGLLSGFFGGFSGHQGALRSAFLIRSGLSKEAFLASGVWIACLVDLSRLPVYAGHFQAREWQPHLGLIAAGMLSAFLGSWLGAKFIQKITLAQVQKVVIVLLGVIAAGLAAGWIG